MGLNNININPKDFAHIEAIILSMTPYERKHPEVLKDSRKLRISKGTYFLEIPSFSLII